MRKRRGLIRVFWGFAYVEFHRNLNFVDTITDAINGFAYVEFHRNLNRCTQFQITSGSFAYVEFHRNLNPAYCIRADGCSFAYVEFHRNLNPLQFPTIHPQSFAYVEFRRSLKPYMGIYRKLKQSNTASSSCLFCAHGNLHETQTPINIRWILQNSNHLANSY